MAYEFNAADAGAAGMQQQPQVTDSPTVPAPKTTDLDRIIGDRSSGSGSGNPNVAALVSPVAANSTTITTTTTTNRTVNMDREDIETVKYLPLHIDLTSSPKQQASHHHHHHHRLDGYGQDRGADDYDYDYDVSSTV